MICLGCKALCIIISFLVLGSICWSSSIVHFRNGPEYFTRRQVFIFLMRFLLCSLVSSSFLVLLRYTFYFYFFHLRLFDGVCFQYSQVLASFLFSEWSDFFSWFSTSTYLLISKSSSSFTNPLEIVPSIPITIGIISIFMFLNPRVWSHPFYSFRHLSFPASRY